MPTLFLVNYVITIISLVDMHDENMLVLHHGVYHESQIQAHAICAIELELWASKCWLGLDGVTV